MPIATSITGLLTAAGSLITAASLLVTAFALFMPQFKKINRQVNDVHKLVNGQRTAMMAYNALLLKTLAAHGIAAPPDPSFDDVAEGDA